MARCLPMVWTSQFDKHWRQLQKQLQNIILEIILRGTRRLSFTKFKQSPKISQKKKWRISDIGYGIFQLKNIWQCVLCYFASLGYHILCPVDFLHIVRLLWNNPTSLKWFHVQAIQLKAMAMVEAFFRKVLQRTYLPELIRCTLASNIIKTQNA